jgi:hypothetical protein
VTATKAVKYAVTLKPDAYGRRVYTLDNISGDVVYVYTPETTADVSKVWFGVDEEPPVLATYSPVIDVRPKTFSRVYLAWSPSEDGKVVTLIVGREASFHVSPPTGVAIAEDRVGFRNALKSVDRDSLNANLKSAEIAVPVDIQYDAVLRFGRNVSPAWVIGSEVTAPAANTNLVSRTVGSGKSGYVYGLLISAGESNDFRLVWISGGTSRSLRIVLASRGTILIVSPVALNEGLPADGGTTVAVRNVNAGSSGVVYQVAILYGEV